MGGVEGKGYSWIGLGLSIWGIFFSVAGYGEVVGGFFPLRIYYVITKLWITLLQGTKLILAVPCAQKILEKEKFLKIHNKKVKIPSAQARWSSLYSRENSFPFFAFCVDTKPVN